MNVLHSAAWAKLKRQMLKDREDLVNQLIHCDSHDKSNTLRGRIQMLDEILERYPIQMGSTEED
jgi:hypothetical protein